MLHYRPISGRSLALTRVQVRAIDGKGRKDKNPAALHWTVDTQAPTLHMSHMPERLTHKTAARFEALPGAPPPPPPPAIYLPCRSLCALLFLPAALRVRVLTDTPLPTCAGGGLGGALQVSLPAGVPPITPAGLDQRGPNAAGAH